MNNTPNQPDDRAQPMTEADVLKGGALGRHADQCERRAQRYEAELEELEEAKRSLIQEGYSPEVVEQAIAPKRRNAQAQAQWLRQEAEPTRADAAILFPKKP